MDRSIGPFFLSSTVQYYSVLFPAAGIATILQYYSFDSFLVVRKGKKVRGGKGEERRGDEKRFDRESGTVGDPITVRD